MKFLPKKHLIGENIQRPEWYNSSNRDQRMIFLDKNENNDEILQKIHAKNLSSISKSSLSNYPDNSYLYNKLANHLEVSPKNLLLGPGSDGIIRSVFETFINQGDKVIITSPTFAMYPIYSKIYQARIIEIEYLSKNGRPYMSVDTVLSALNSSGAKLFCLPNPDSPTGTIFDEEEIKSIIKTANENSTLVLIDEAYYPFYNNTAIKFIDSFENLIIARTFAKAWALAGLRTGYGISSKNLIQYMHKIKSMYEINTLASNMLCNTIDNYSDVMESVDRLNSGKNWFIDELRKLNFDVWESHGNFFHINFGDFSNQIHDKLSKIVLYRKEFKEDCLIGFSRFSSTTKKEFAIILNEIKNVVLK